MAEQAKIPEYLGKCDIVHVHDDGDLTIKCGGKKYVVTTEGEVFKKVKIRSVVVGNTSIVVEGDPENFEVKVLELGRVIPKGKGELPRYPDLEEAIDIGRGLL